MSFEVNRRLAAKRPPLQTRAEIDSVTAGIIRGAFETTCFEAAVHLGRAASSAIINQSNERNGSVIDGNGRLAGLSVGIPQLLFISPLAVRRWTLWGGAVPAVAAAVGLWFVVSGWSLLALAWVPAMWLLAVLRQRSWQWSLG